MTKTAFYSFFDYLIVISLMTVSILINNTFLALFFMILALSSLFQISLTSYEAGLIPLFKFKTHSKINIFIGISLLLFSLTYAQQILEISILCLIGFSKIIFYGLALKNG